MHVHASEPIVAQRLVHAMERRMTVSRRLLADHVDEDAAHEFLAAAQAECDARVELFGAALERPSQMVGTQPRHRGESC